MVQVLLFPGVIPVMQEGSNDAQTARSSTVRTDERSDRSRGNPVNPHWLGRCAQDGPPSGHRSLNGIMLRRDPSYVISFSFSDSYEAGIRPCDRVSVTVVFGVETSAQTSTPRMNPRWE